jgi:XRE family transcriptional regulator, aerobic/anaerobic benzoate catabolism transcriptional regulator
MKAAAHFPFMARVFNHYKLHQFAFRMNTEEEKNRLLQGLGTKVRRLRNEADLTTKELAKRAGLSSRFVIQLEAGQGNISVAGLARVASALGRPLPELFPPAINDRSVRAQLWERLCNSSDEELQDFQRWFEQRNGETDRPFIALIGLRGAGKSTVGVRLAKKLKSDFVELDSRVEQAAGMSLGEIFSMHGEEYYRRLEQIELVRLFKESPGCVLATGGSLVTDAESWSLVKRRCFTVWLRATPEEHMARVLKQGDTRPMKDNPSAMNELKNLLWRREPLYSEAELTIKTSDQTPAEVVNQITKSIPRFIKR